MTAPPLSPRPAGRRSPAACRLGNRRRLLLWLPVLAALAGCGAATDLLGPKNRLIGVWQGGAAAKVDQPDKLNLWLDSVTLRVPNSRRIEIERQLTRDGKSWQETDSGTWTVVQDRDQKMVIKVNLRREKLQLLKELVITFTGEDEIQLREQQGDDSMPPLVLKRQ